MESVQNIKLRFGIIGNNPLLNRSLEKAIQVAPTEISVLVVGESGVGKEFIPKIIHQNSIRKHQNYIAVNCGAIPEGTIDSELFGHEKGSFTGADKPRKGYFEVADGGTIFLDEIGELPLTSQVRLLRVLENGEFMKVGSSQVQKTNVRIVAATNVNMINAVEKGKFREDLYYRLNTVQINIPSLRDRKEDISLLFRKFSNDFSEKYKMPYISLLDDSIEYLKNYYWPGNIRQLRNFAEQITILEANRNISLDKIKEYLPITNTSLIISNNKKNENTDFSSEREILYKILFDMRKDLNDLKSLTLEFINNKPNTNDFSNTQKDLINKVFNSKKQEEENIPRILINENKENFANFIENKTNEFEEMDYEELEPYKESLSIMDKEIELIRKALEKYSGKRKLAAQELGISERTLYRKIKQFDLE